MKVVTEYIMFIGYILCFDSVIKVTYKVIMRIDFWFCRKIPIMVGQFVILSSIIVGCVSPGIDSQDGPCYCAIKYSSIAAMKYGFVPG